MDQEPATDMQTANNAPSEWTLDTLGSIMVARFDEAKTASAEILNKVAILQAEVDDLKEENQQQSKQIESMESRIQALENQLERVESKQRDKSIVVFGLPTPPADRRINLVQKMTNFFAQRLQIRVKVESAALIGKNKPTLPVVVEFLSKSDKIAVFKNWNKLADSGIFVQDDLTKTTREKRKEVLPIYRKLQEDGKKVSLRGCRIFMDGKPYEDNEWDLHPALRA